MIPTLVLAILIAPAALVTAMFIVELLAGLPRMKERRRGRTDVDAVILVPAHDEAAIIAESISALRSAAGEHKVLVIADNCSDRTAELARNSGAEVIERDDPERRGKGFALAFAARHLETATPQIVIVVDADCRTDRESLDALIGAAATLGRPVQAVNLLRPDRSDPPMVQLSTFGFMLKNLVRQRGLQRLSGGVHLTGTGMAMPFHMFRQARLATPDVVEDLALGLEFAERGRAPSLVSDAQVWSGASGGEGTLIQRRRWEGGYLRTALRSAPQLLWNSVRRGRLDRLLAALDLLVPPLALLALVNGAVLVAGLVLVALGASAWLLVVQVAVLALALLAVFLAWLREGRDFISLAVLARLPLYVLWKLPLYLGLGRRGAPSDWLRTGR